MSETAAHDHELEVLEDDQKVPPRPEEQIADARRRRRRDDRPASRTEPRPRHGDCSGLAATVGPGSHDPGSGPEGWTRAEPPAYGEFVRAVSLLLLCRDEA